MGRSASHVGAGPIPEVVVEDMEAGRETDPLLPQARLSRPEAKVHYGTAGEQLDGGNVHTGWFGRQLKARGKSAVQTMKDPETWSSRAFEQYAVDGVKLLSAVFLGLLLNILDGLSYGTSILND
jgi:sulfate permease, SulP family